MLHIYKALVGLDKRKIFCTPKIAFATPISGWLAPVKLRFEYPLLKYIKLEILFQSFDFLGGYTDALAYLDCLNFAISNEPINGWL